LLSVTHRFCFKWSYELINTYAYAFIVLIAYEKEIIATPTIPFWIYS